MTQSLTKSRKSSRNMLFYPKDKACRKNSYSRLFFVNSSRWKVRTFETLGNGDISGCTCHRNTRVSGRKLFPCNYFVQFQSCSRVHTFLDLQNSSKFRGSFSLFSKWFQILLNQNPQIWKRLKQKQISSGIKNYLFQDFNLKASWLAYFRNLVC